MRLTRLLILSLALVTSCAKSFDDTTLTPDKVEVVIGASDAASTRTAINGNGTTVEWCVDDKIALWAEEATANTTTLSAEEFSIRYFGNEFNEAYFASTISPMAEGSYNYSAFYPYPDSETNSVSISGNTVSYTIPTTQDGTYNGDIDFRIADVVNGSALSDEIILNSPKLYFRSITHALKITIPEGCNALGNDIKKLTVTFPEGSSIAGDASITVGGSGASSTLSSNISNSITLNMSSDPINVGDVVWMFINPLSVESGNITIDAIGAANEVAYSKSYDISGLNFAAGYYSEINTEIGEQKPTTTITLSINDDNLGEDLTNINVVAPTGVTFIESGSNKAVIQNDGSKTYTLSFINADSGSAMWGNAIEVEYESEQTLLSNKKASVTISQPTNLALNNTITGNLTVPYLLDENFDTVSALSSNDNTDYGLESNSGYKGFVDLTGTKTSGWRGTRIGAGEKTAIRICARYESTSDNLALASSIFGIEGTTYSIGRVNTPPIDGLKEEANISVSFKYKGSRYSKYNTKSYYLLFPSKWTVGGDGYTLISYGSTQDGDESEDDYESFEEACVENEAISGTDSCTETQTYTGINISIPNADNSKVFEIKGANSSTRISWIVNTNTTTTKTWGVNGNFWVYLDDIQVKVIPN